jgi:hypothetical protein
MRDLGAAPVAAMPASLPEVQGGERGSGRSSTILRRPRNFSGC